MSRFLAHNLLVLCLAVPAFAKSILPREFMVRAASPARFEVYGGTALVARVVHRTEGDSQVFEFGDEKGKSFLFARLRPRPWGSELFIFDGKGNRLGLAREKVERNLLFRDKVQWELVDQGDKKICQSTKEDLMATQFTLAPAGGAAAIEFSRPLVSAGTYWKVRLPDPEPLDSRVVMAFAVYRLASDAERRQRR